VTYSPEKLKTINAFYSKGSIQRLELFLNELASWAWTTCSSQADAQNL
jgi:hypothetical protein